MAAQNSRRVLLRHYVERKARTWWKQKPGYQVDKLAEWGVCALWILDDLWDSKEHTPLCPSSTLLHMLSEALAVDGHYGVSLRVTLHVMSWTESGPELQKPLWQDLDYVTLSFLLESKQPHLWSSGHWVVLVIMHNNQKIALIVKWML